MQPLNETPLNEAPQEQNPQNLPLPQNLWKKRLFSWGKTVVFALVIVWVAREIYKTSGEIAGYRWSVHWGWIFLSCLLYFAAYLPAWVYWHLCLKTLGQKPHLFNSFRAYFIGHLGKYVPGKAVVVGLRAGLVHTPEVRVSIAIATVFLETLTMMAVGSMISAVILFIFFRDQQLLMLIALGLMICSGLPVIPGIFKQLALWAGVGKKSPEIREHLNNLSFKTLLSGWGLMTITWLFMGISLWATIRGVGIEPGSLLEHFPMFVAATALSTVGGFLSMIPGGLGVRELILAGIMNKYFQTLVLPQGLAAEAAGLVVAGITRLISILTELALSALLIGFKKR